MLNVVSKTCNRACISACISGLKAMSGGFLLHSALVDSLTRKDFSDHFPRKRFLEKTSKKFFAARESTLGLVDWFGWRTTGFTSAENFHGNIANSRIHTSSQEKIPGKKSKKFGEWVGSLLNGNQGIE